MKRLYTLLFLILSMQLYVSALEQSLPVDTTKAVKIAKKAEKLMAKGKEAEAWNLYEEAGKLGLMSAQRELMEHYASCDMINNACFWLEKLAKSGDADAQYAMGYTYMNGSEDTGQTMFEVDHDKAYQWFKRAYDQGSKDSAYQMGLIECEKEDFQAAITHLKECAEEVPMAYYILAELYYAGEEGVKQDFNKAFYYAQKAAEKGIERAMFRLGYMYMNGEGCRVDYEQGIYWNEKAAESDDEGLAASARNNINVAKEHLRGTGTDSEGVRAYRKGAELGQDVAQANLANCYWNGTGLSQDYQQAVYWYRKAAEQGYATAQSRLGMAYSEGLGVEKNLDTAKMWYERAAEQNDTIALYNLCLIYQNEQNFVKAFQYAKRAADLNCVESFATLSYYYREGIGTSPDHDMAYKMAEKAVDRHNRRGYISMADLFGMNLGLPPEYKSATPDKRYALAIEYYKKAYDPSWDDCHLLEDQIARCYSGMESYSECFRWALKAGTPWCNYAIAWMYGTGKGVGQNMATSKRYMQKAANQNEDVDVRNLAREALKHY